MSRRDREKSRLLSSVPDADGASNAFTSDDETDVPPGRTSTEIARHDRQILDEEEEREKLLTGHASGFRGLRGFLRRWSNEGNGTRKRRNSARLRSEKERGRLEETGELLHDVEEGDYTDTYESSSSEEQQRFGGRQPQEQTCSWKPPGICKRAIVTLLIIVVFIALMWAAWRASANQYARHGFKILSNGTASFGPTTILISLDGFRADFLQRNLTPTLRSFIAEGVSPQYMLPSFPSLTFPNHYTMVTGLYPESHGIVGNTFWDPSLRERFYYTNISTSMVPKWWGGEPLWVTAESQGARSAIHMWPGSEAHIAGVEPSHVDKYNGSELLSVKVNRILQLLDLPGQEAASVAPDQMRPQLIAAYVPVVDSDGHSYGPNSTEIQATITAVDTMLGDLFQGLEARNLTSIVNVIVVSDHGMATTDVSRLIQLDDIVDLSLVEHDDGWPLHGLRPKDPGDLDTLYSQLMENTKDNPNVEIYLRDKHMPKRYHFHRNERIAPLWVIPKAGWAVVDKAEFDVKEAQAAGKVYHPRGLHGYDHEHPLMRAIFIARGPAFPHAPGSRMEPFQNIELYNIVCDSIGIVPKPNNGTLRLPLNPVGLHMDVDAPDAPDDPPTHPQHMGHHTVTGMTMTMDMAATVMRPAPVPTQMPAGGGSHESENEEEAEQEPEQQDEGYIESVWHWITGKIQGAKSWALDLLNDKGAGGN